MNRKGSGYTALNVPVFGTDSDERPRTNEIQQAVGGDQSGEQFNDSGAKSGDGSSEDENNKSMDMQKHEKFFVPVAFVICTEIENHDIFRGIL